MSELARRVIAYSQGESMSFTDIKVEPALTDFSTRVRAFVQTIPYGAVQTYGAVSKAVGSPRSARAVGTVMRTNPVPLVVPCHRVVGTGNRLVGFSAGTGVSLKNQLLKLEGNKEQFVL
ncbi:MAG: MGMT family protein [Planctomycetota bacterium]|nr:MGMT family protein [Planctomycetota bacterium]